MQVHVDRLKVMHEHRPLYKYIEPQYSLALVHALRSEKVHSGFEGLQEKNVSFVWVDE